MFVFFCFCPPHIFGHSTTKNPGRLDAGTVITSIIVIRLKNDTHTVSQPHDRKLRFRQYLSFYRARRNRARVHCLLLFYVQLGFLSRGLTDRREILHGGLATSQTGLVPFWGIAPGMDELWASTEAIWRDMLLAEALVCFLATPYLRRLD